MERNVTQVNSKLFVHHPRHKLISTEHSDIGNINFQPLYDDACDVGLALRNHKTGSVTRWNLSESDTMKDPEGEIVYWTLHPTPESVRKFPATAGYRMRIYND